MWRRVPRQAAARRLTGAGVGACVDVSRFGSGRDTQRRQQFVMYRTDHTRRQRHPLAACGCAKSSDTARTAGGAQGHAGVITPLETSPWAAAFAKRLHELGWIEGRNRNRVPLG
jgi:hypothetical protein